MEEDNSLIISHFIGNNSLDLLQTRRERLEMNHLTILDGNVAGLVPIGRNVSFLQSMNEQVEATDAFEQR